MRARDEFTELLCDLPTDALRAVREMVECMAETQDEPLRHAALMARLEQLTQSGDVSAETIRQTIADWRAEEVIVSRIEWDAESIEALLNVDLADESTWPKAMCAECDRRLGLNLAAEMEEDGWVSEEARRTGHLRYLVERRLVNQEVHINALQNALASLLPEDGPAKRLMLALGTACLDIQMEAIALASRIEREMGDALPIGGRFASLAERTIERVMAL